MYSIGEAAQKIGVSSSTLRYYDKEGLLPMVERSSGGIRVFKESDFEWLKLIECLKATGMPIKDIKQFIDWFMEGDSTLEQRRDMFYERKKAVEAQMKELQKTLDTIKYKCWYYDTAVEAGTADVPKNMKFDEYPEKIRELKLRSIFSVTEEY
jgi:DNA-binding transcriptional MerR regulator